MYRTRLTWMIPLAAALACTDQAPTETAPEPSLSAVLAPTAGPAGRSMILRLKGTVVGTTKTLPVPTALGTTTGNCFTLDLFDMTSGHKVGTADDCLADITVTDTPFGPAIALTGTTIFNLDNGSSFVTRGLTTVSPTTHGSPDVTHITGAIPQEGENGVLLGTGKFARLQAMARLSGAVNLSQLDANIIGFDCIFVITPL